MPGTKATSPDHANRCRISLQRNFRLEPPGRPGGSDLVTPKGPEQELASPDPHAVARRDQHALTSSSGGQDWVLRPGPEREGLGKPRP